jgi:polyferredoxin
MIWKRVLRPRTLVYTFVLVAIAGIAGASLATRNPLKVDIIRDRGALAREAAPGVIENVYRMQIMNTDEVPRRYEIEASGLHGLTVVGVEQPVEVKAASTRLFALRLQAPLEPGDGHAPPRPGTHKIELKVEAVEGPGDAEHHRDVERHEQSTFIIPK